MVNKVPVRNRRARPNRNCLKKCFSNKKLKIKVLDIVKLFWLKYAYNVSAKCIITPEIIKFNIIMNKNA